MNPMERSKSDWTNSVIRKFEELFGPVENEVIREQVWQDPDISVHIIRPSANQQCFTLFTTGMSSRPLNVPADAKQYQFAELFVQLPPTWKIDAISLRSADYRWPIDWLRKLARYPHLTGSWMAGPCGVLSNENASISPDEDFVAMLLLAELEVTRPDSYPIQLYRLMPLFQEEFDLENESGIAALLRRFDERSVPFVIDTNRENAGKSS